MLHGPIYLICSSNMGLAADDPYQDLVGRGDRLMELVDSLANHHTNSSYIIHITAVAITSRVWTSAFIAASTPTSSVLAHWYSS